MGGDSRCHGIHTEKRALGGFGIGDFQPVCFVEGDDELKGIYGVQADASWAEQRLVIRDFLRFKLQHEIFHHEPFDVLLEGCCIFHFKTVGLASARGRISGFFNE